MAALSSNQRAWLDTIAKAEGTYFGGDAKGYRTMFGYQGELDTNQQHPDRVIRSGGYASAAAGRYQFMPGTWGEAVRALKLDGRMTPENQDQAALYLMRRRGVDPDSAISDQSLAKLAPEWASLPNLQGQSHYGQPVKKRDELVSFFRQRASAAPNPGNGGASVAAAGAPSPVAPAAPVPAGGGSGGGGISAGAGAVPLNLAGFDPTPLLATLDGGSSRSSRLSAPALMGGFGSPAAASVLQQQGELLSRPLASLRPRLSSVSRMAGSPGRGFMQQLLALTQRPSVLA